MGYEICNTLLDLCDPDQSKVSAIWLQRSFCQLHAFCDLNEFSWMDYDWITVPSGFWGLVEEESIGNRAIGFPYRSQLLYSLFRSALAVCLYARDRIVFTLYSDLLRFHLRQRK